MKERYTAIIIIISAKGDHDHQMEENLILIFLFVVLTFSNKNRISVVIDLIYELHLKCTVSFQFPPPFDPKAN